MAFQFPRRIGDYARIAVVLLLLVTSKSAFVQDNVGDDSTVVFESGIEVPELKKKLDAVKLQIP
ncbi:MAG: hypothetical protein HQ498_06520 [Pseudohongiella sp.]|jgi:hypothetical protein|nr:hypothetical protein [Pseudohongiella sp.]